MKKIVVSIAMLLVAFGSFCQTNTFPADGNVGIGTNNPDYPFELNSNKGGGGMFSLLNTTGIESSISYRISNKNTNTGWVVGNYQDDYFFWSYTKGSQTVTFKPNGNVGIGIRTPYSKLNINTEGNAATDGITLQNGATQQHFWYLAENTRSDFKIGSSHGEWSWTNSNGEMVRITSSGNVGIGTSDPKYPLTVKGAINAEANGDYYGAWFGGEARTAKPSINVGSWYNNRGSMFWDAANKKLKFETCNNSEQYYPNTMVMYNGMVGIGTSETNGHRLAVNGSISATEIKVEAQTADFVFEEDYQLKSLEEVEQFVQKNKHLPDVPSAKQMEEDGVGLAEMNKLLLQKVEELTLYLIDEHKKNNQQATEISYLKKQLLEQNQIIQELSNRLK
jgi:hypothetical protein